MRLNYDLEKNQFLVVPGVPEELTRATVKRGDSSKVEVVFYRGIVVQDLGTATAKFGGKEMGEYDGDFVVYSGSWIKTGFGSATVYKFTPNWNTTELNDLVTEAAEAGFVEIMAEIEVTDGAEIFSTPTLTIRVNSDVIKGGEGMSTDANPPYPASTEIPQFLMGITGLVGGAITDLDGIATSTDNYDDRLVIIIVGGILSMYRLTAGTEDTASPGIIRPADYHADTNAKYWQQVL